MKILLIIIFSLLIPRVAYCLDNTIYTCPNPAITAIFISEDSCTDGCAPNYYKCTDPMIGNTVSYKDEQTCFVNCGGVKGVCNRQEGVMTQYTCNCDSCVGKGIQKFDRTSCEKDCTEPAWECGLDHQLWDTSTECGAHCNNVFKGVCTKKTMDITTFVCPADSNIKSVDLAVCDAQCNTQTYTCSATGQVFKAIDYGDSAAAALAACNLPANCSPHAVGTCTSTVVTNTKWVCPNDTATVKTQNDTKAICEAAAPTGNGKCVNTTFQCVLPGQTVNGTSYPDSSTCGAACQAEVASACIKYTGPESYLPQWICPNNLATGLPLPKGGNVGASYYTTVSLDDCNANCASTPPIMCGDGSRQDVTPYEARINGAYSYAFKTVWPNMATCNESCKNYTCYALKTGVNRPTVGGLVHMTDFTVYEPTRMNPLWIAIPGDTTDGTYAAMSVAGSGVYISSVVYPNQAACLNAIPIDGRFSLYPYWLNANSTPATCNGGTRIAGTGCKDVSNSTGFSNIWQSRWTCGPIVNGFLPADNQSFYLGATTCANTCRIKTPGTCGPVSAVTPCTSVANTIYGDKVTCLFPADTRTPGSMNNTTYTGNGSEAADTAACETACQADLAAPCNVGQAHVDCTSTIEPTYLGYQCVLGVNTAMITGNGSEDADAAACATQCQTTTNGGCVETTKTTPCDATQIMGYIGYECDANNKKTYLGIKNGAGVIDELLDFNVCKSSCQTGTENCLLVDAESICLSANKTTVWECLNPAQINFFNTEAKCNDNCVDVFFRCMMDKTSYIDMDHCDKFCSVKNLKDCTRIEQSGTEWNCPVLEYKSYSEADCKANCTEPGWTCILNDKKYAQAEENTCLTECVGNIDGECKSDKDDWYVCPMDNSIKDLIESTCQSNCLESKWTCNSDKVDYTNATAQAAYSGDGAAQCAALCDGKVAGTCTPQTTSESQWTCSTDTSDPKNIYSVANSGANAESVCRDHCFETQWRCDLPGAPINQTTGTSIDGSIYSTEDACDATKGGACKLTDGCIKYTGPESYLPQWICPNNLATGLPLPSASGSYKGASYYTTVSLDDCNSNCAFTSPIMCGEGSRQDVTPYEARINGAYSYAFKTVWPNMATCNESCKNYTCYALKTGVNRPTVGGLVHMTDFTVYEPTIMNPLWIAIPGDTTDGTYAAMSVASSGVYISSVVYPNQAACLSAIPIDERFSLYPYWLNANSTPATCNGGARVAGTGCKDVSSLNGFSNIWQSRWTCGPIVNGFLPAGNQSFYMGAATCENACTTPIYGTCSSFQQNKDCDNNPLQIYTGTKCETKNSSAPTPPNGTIYNDFPGNEAGNNSVCLDACFEQVTPECVSGNNNIPCELRPDYRGVNCMINGVIALEDTTNLPLSWFTDTTSEADDKAMCSARCAKSNNLCIESTNTVDCESAFSTDYSGFVCQEDYSVYNTGDAAIDAAKCGQSCFTVVNQGPCEPQTVSPDKRCIEIRLETPECTAINESETTTFECKVGEATNSYATEDECLAACTTSSGKCELFGRAVACTSTDGVTPGKAKCKSSGVEYDDTQSCLNACNTTVACINGTGQCPIGTNKQCTDVGDPANYTDGPGEDPALMLAYQHDESQVDAGGNCLGQILLFNGKAERCNKSGLQNSWKDCCKADADVTSAIDQQMGLLKTLKMAKELKDAYDTVTAGVAIYQAGVSIGASTVAAEGIASSLSVASATSIAGGGAALSGAGMWTSAVTEYASSLINPASIAIYAVVYVAMEVFSKTCTSEDVMTAAYNDLGLCHYNGEECTKEIDFFAGSWCAQRTKFYCCFNSKMARIIHEQVRASAGTGNDPIAGATPQIAALEFKDNTHAGLGGNVCRGFTPEEFSMIDFSKIDFTEIFGDIQDKINKLDITAPTATPSVNPDLGQSKLQSRIQERL